MRSCSRFLRAFATMFKRGYDGDYAVIPSEAAVPNLQRRMPPATTFRNPARTKRADSAEARVSRQFEADVVDLTSTLAIPLSDFDLRDDGARWVSGGAERAVLADRTADNAGAVERQFRAGAPRDSMKATL